MIEMEFQRLAASIVNNILGPSEKGQFRTVGFQRQETDSQENLAFDRSVQVYFFSGDFPKGASKSRGPYQHDVTFRLDFTVAADPQGDIETIKKDGATESEIIAALKTFQNSAAEADRLLDELYAIVFQILMSGVNYYMGLPKYTFANRWVSGFQKDDPVEQGQDLILTGSALLTGRVVEVVESATVTPATEGVLTDISVNEDPEGKAGVQVKPTGG